MDEASAHSWEQICELIWSCAISQAIHVAVELGIPEILDGAPRTVAELAAATGSEAWTLETVLHALAAFGVLRLNELEQYELTQAGRFLLISTPGSKAGEAGVFFDTVYRPLGALKEVVTSGDVAFDRVYGKSFYDYLAVNPALAAYFYDTMEANSSYRFAGLSSVYDFSGVSWVIDVGGGEGSLMIQILREHREIRGAVFDLPVVSDRARARIEAAQLSHRCDVLSGDFRNSVPAGADLYILAQILNNWRDADARQVLANCRAAMPTGARLLILEPIYMPGPLSRWRTLVSLGVMAQRGGRTRSEAQIKTLLNSAGFRVDAIHPFPSSPTCAVVAQAAG